MRQTDIKIVQEHVRGAFNKLGTFIDSTHMKL